MGRALQSLHVPHPARMAEVFSMDRVVRRDVLVDRAESTSRSSRRGRSGPALWTLGLLLSLPSLASSQAVRTAVTPSPLTTSPPQQPRILEPLPPLPPPPVPAQDRPILPQALPPLPLREGIRTQVIDLRPDATGLVPDRPPGAARAITREDASKQVEELIEPLREAEGEISIVVGRSRIIQTREPLTRIAVTNPNVADVELINDQPNTRLLNLYGRTYGTTDLTLWDQKNRPTTFLVRVTIDTRDLESRLRQIFPGADVRIRQVGRQIILEGQVPDAKTMSEVLGIVTAELQSGIQGSGGGSTGGTGGAPAASASVPIPPTSPGTSTSTSFSQTTGPAQIGGGIPIINRVRVPGPRQVLLHVKIAELNRTAIRQIGVDFLYKKGSTTVGSTIGSIGNVTEGGATPGSNTQLFGVFNAGQFTILLNALRQNSLAKILAEPNLITLDGQPAQFIAGGSFPYPVPQSNLGSGSGITIQFAQFGAIVNFLPHILRDDVIRLDVSPTFSELNTSSGTSVNGTSVPGITERSARTVVELREGQTLAIAGLLQSQTQATTSRIPGVGDLPLVGVLFSQNQISTVETELVVLVTPELIGPMEKAEVPPAPGDLVLQPNDFEFFFLGRIESKTGKDFRATVREHDPLNVMKHFRSEERHVVGPHGYLD
jgi:pilus assembly protein CpaC